MSTLRLIEDIQELPFIGEEDTNNDDNHSQQCIQIYPGGVRWAFCPPLVAWPINMASRTVKRFEKRGNGKSTEPHTSWHRISTIHLQVSDTCPGFWPCSQWYSGHSSGYCNAPVCPGCWISLYEWGYSPEYIKHALPSSEFSAENSLYMKAILQPWLINVLAEAVTHQHPVCEHSSSWSVWLLLAMSFPNGLHLG